MSVQITTLLGSVLFRHPICSLGAHSVTCVDRIGTEHEKLGYYKDSHKRISYNDIARLLSGLCEKHQWIPIMEGEYIIGAEKDGQSVTIEPGGQFELSGAPVATLHDTLTEVKWHIDEVQSVLLKYLSSSRTEI